MTTLCDYQKAGPTLSWLTSNWSVSRCFPRRINCLIYPSYRWVSRIPKYRITFTSPFGSKPLRKHGIYFNVFWMFPAFTTLQWSTWITFVERDFSRGIQDFWASFHIEVYPNKVSCCPYLQVHCWQEPVVRSSSKNDGKQPYQHPHPY